MSSSWTGCQTKPSFEEIEAVARDAETTYPFLVHSQESLSQQAPPDIDNHRLARQKRRRTSPEDHAILEAEYERNPKPDKSARLQIVRKVALGEKEVQIWFQNRRQVTRRKSRPLSTFEILPNLHSASEFSDHAPSSSYLVVPCSQQTQSSSQNNVVPCPSQSSDLNTVASDQTSPVPDVQEQVRSGHGSPRGADTNLEMSETRLSQKAHTEIQSVTSVDANDRVRAIRIGGLSRSISQTLPRTQRPNPFGSRRSASFIIYGDSDHAGYPSVHGQTPSNVVQSECGKDTLPVSQSRHRTSSLVRLSMSLDGKAKVTTSTGTTPSPPRPQPASYVISSYCPGKGLQRSLSAVEPGKKDSPSSCSNPTFRRQATGRSRDARTWEFYCDKDARDALTEQAEREESGSATAAIALIKTNSNVNKAIAIKSNKRNAHSHKLEAAKKLKTERQKMEKPKLGRSQSLYDNMHAFTKSQLVEAKAGKSSRKNDLPSTFSGLHDGDSDKENWVPGTQQRSPPRRRPKALSKSRRVLEESVRYSSGLSALISQERNVSSGLSSLESTSSIGSEEKENKAFAIEDELEAFHGNPVAPREADDLDCVQNLLSLSQATWQ